jgi:hypothetical protein
MSGAFRISFGGHHSSFLRHNASAQNVRDAIHGLNFERFKYIQVDRVELNKTPENQLDLKRAREATGFYGDDGNDDGIRYQGGHRWCIEFINVTGDIETVNIDSSRLEGAGVSAASEEQIAGHERLDGTFVLTFSGDSTVRIPHDASSLVVKNSIQSLPSIGSISVTRMQLHHAGHVSPMGSQWNITFTSLSTPENLGPMPLMSITSLMLTGTGVSATIHKIASGCCTFRISGNGVDFILPGLSFRFDSVAMVTSVEPSTGPASGGTILSIKGVGFWDGTVSCIFGEIPYHVEVPATRINDEHVLCTTPAQSRGLLIATRTSGENFPDVFFGSPLDRGSVRVRVNIGGKMSSNSTSHSRLYFTYNARSRVMALVPKIGPLSGGTIIRIHGQDFPDQGYARRGVLCKFGDAPNLVVGV